jgi:hypothetical protein
MHAAAERPSGRSGVRLVPQTGHDEAEVWFRAQAGRVPDVLEIGLRGRRRPRVEAFWDGRRAALRVAAAGELIWRANLIG